jgi:hypothetical protein
MDQNRRRRLRVPVPAKLQGSLAVGVDLRVLDLSETGALIEHGEPLVSGEACLLALRLGGAELRLRARVVWCDVDRLTPTPRGDQISYRSGLEFTEVPAGAKGQLGRFLALLSEESRGGALPQE